MGMALMAFLFIVYYGMFATKPVVLEPIQPSENVYEYDEIHEIKPNEIKTRDFPQSEDNSGDTEYYASDGGVQHAFRNKRTPNSGSASLTTEQDLESLRMASSLSNQPNFTELPATSAVPTLSNKSTKLKGGGSSSPTTVTEVAEDFNPDFHLGNSVMDAVFNQAELADMKVPLGLCRKNADIKVPELKATLFPAYEATEILNCINDLFKNQAKTQICLHLDEEMNAYLRWLVLTGEPKEKHKSVKTSVKDNFLFNSSGVTELPGHKSTECLVEPAVKENFQE